MISQPFILFFVFLGASFLVAPYALLLVVFTCFFWHGFYVVFLRYIIDFMVEKSINLFGRLSRRFSHVGWGGVGWGFPIGFSIGFILGFYIHGQFQTYFYMYTAAPCLGLGSGLIIYGTLYGRNVN